MTSGSLRLRLLVAAAVSVAAALALSALGLMLIFERHVERRVETELGVHLEQVLAGLAAGPDGPVVADPPADPRFHKPLSGLYWQARTGGTVIRSRSLWDTELAPPADALADGAVHRHRIDGPDGAELIAVERNVRLPASLGGGEVRVVVAQDAADIRAATNAFGRDILPYLALLAGFLIGAAYVQVAVGLRPLAAVRDRLAAIGEGRLRRLGDAFPAEIRPLARQVDSLLTARERQIERAKVRAGDLAHGLKTPLQVLAGDVERLRAKGETAIAEDIEQVTTVMRRHVERELARARMAAGNPDATAAVADVVARVVAVVQRTPDGTRLAWRTDVPPALRARIDPDDLAEAIGNLVENAARHARRSVAVTARDTDGEVAIAVRDDGPGMPEEQAETARRRGARFDSGGSGLGLAIVGDIAEAWNGRVELRNGLAGFEAVLTVAAGGR